MATFKIHTKNHYTTDEDIISDATRSMLLIMLEHIRIKKAPTGYISLSAQIIASVAALNIGSIVSSNFDDHTCAQHDEAIKDYFKCLKDLMAEHEQNVLKNYKNITKVAKAKYGSILRA
jgi:hypothetical protein